MLTRRSSKWVFVLWLAALLFIHRYLFSGTVEAGRDLYRLFIPEAAYLRERLLRGEIPLWNPHVRLGQPFAATLTSEVFYPPHVLLVLLLGPIWGIQASLVFHAGLASAGAYFASRKLGAGRWGGVLAGVFGFTPLWTRLASSLHMLSAMAWSGWVVVAALNLARRPSLRTAAWLALPLALSFHAGAPEVVLWQSALALGFALTARLPRRALAFTALAGGWCFALSAIAVFPAAELWRASVVPGGGLDDRYDWSTAPAQLLSMFWPFADEKRSPELFGRDQWLATTLFIGAIPGLLAVLALRKNKRVAVLAVVAVACAVLCLGRHFLPARLLLALPPFSGFRHPVKYAFGLSFCIALLSGQGLRRLAVLARRERPRIRQVAVALVVGVASLAVLQALAGLAPWREGMKSGALYFGLCGLAIALLFAVLSGRGPGARRVRGAVLALALAEVTIAGAMMGNVALVPPATLAVPSTLAAAIRSEPHGRVSIFLEDAESQKPDSDERKTPARQFITDSRENLIGLTPLEESLSMVEGYGFRDPWRLTMALQDDPRGPYDVFGVSHFVRHTASAPFADLEPVASSSWSRVFRSHTTFPRAWVVHQSALATNLEALNTLRSNAPLLRTRALVGPTAELIDEQPACDSTVRLEPISDEAIALHAEACARGYLVIADSNYPGWVAQVNGVEQPIFKADFLLNAVAIPSGRSEVRIEYRPWSFRLGAIVTVLGLLGLLGGLGPKFRPKFLKPHGPALSSR